MKKLAFFLLYLTLNFGALAVGSFLMGSSPNENTWYIELNQAPWTPPGYVFGLAWTLIMLCFSIYLTFSHVFVLGEKKRRNTYLIHLFLNIIWNPLFFQFHLTWIAFPILVGLLISLIVLNRRMNYTWKTGHSWLLMPYFIWLIIAGSLNAYIAIMN